MSVLRDIGAAAIWLIVAMVVAIGAAGIVSGVGGVPGTAARSELTWAGDRELRGEINATTERIAELAEEIDALGEKGRLALTFIAARDVYRAQATVDEGSVIAARIGTLAENLQAATAAMQGTGPLTVLRYAPDVVSQRTFVASATSATDGVEETWQRFSAAAVAAERLATLLTLHDEQTGAALKLGSEFEFAKALVALDDSDATMTEIDRLHDQLAAAADTTILATWIERHVAYDVALRTYFAELIKSKGRATTEVKAAFAAEQKARALLPKDTRALSVIMAEVAQAGLQQAVITIQQTRIQVDDIIAKLDAGA
ncbi:MAG TPA: hypothetical protein VIH00_11265 [Candidatus Limnocylindrales bacterium]